MKLLPSVWIAILLIAHPVFGLDAASAEHDDDDQVCVTLQKFDNMKCKGHAKGSNSFTALTTPGSACKHTAKMKNNSAKDQFCHIEKGIFHQTVFVHNKQCRVEWTQKAFSPMHLEYTADTCTYGYKLESCNPGPCPAGADGDIESELVERIELLRERR
jgi:hypothetical protein